MNAAFLCIEAGLFLPHRRGNKRQSHPENCIDREQCVEACTKDVIELIEGQIPILKSGENSASKN